MKFTIGDATDAKLVRSMSDEMHKCELAWQTFERVAGPNIYRVKGVQKATHDAYVEFLHHLYEFYLAAMVRDARDTEWDKAIQGRKPHEARDLRLSSEAMRCVTSRMHGIEHKYAPAWENGISHYRRLLALLQDSAGLLTPDFGKAFRDVRNHHAGHATHKRITVSTIQFFKTYHCLVYLLFQNAWTWRGAKSSIGEDFDLSPKTS